MTKRVFDYFKVHRVDSHCLLLCWEVGWKRRVSCDFINWPLSDLKTIFLPTFFYFCKQKMWNVANDGMPLTLSPPSPSKTNISVPSMFYWFNYYSFTFLFTCKFIFEDFPICYVSLEREFIAEYSAINLIKLLSLTR